LRGGAEPDDGRVPMPSGAEGHGEGAHLAMRSAMMAEDTLSISAPPYSSGISTLVNPRSAAFLSSSRLKAKSLCSIRSELGRFPDWQSLGGLLDELVLVVEIFRVNTSCGLVSSMRKFPPHFFLRECRWGCHAIPPNFVMLGGASHICRLRQMWAPAVDVSRCFRRFRLRPCRRRRTW